MVRGLLGWRFEFGGVERCHLIRRVHACFISGLDMVGYGLLLSGVMGWLSPFVFFVVSFPRHFFL